MIAVYLNDLVPRLQALLCRRTAWLDRGDKYPHIVAPRQTDPYRSLLLEADEPGVWSETHTQF